MGNFFVPEGARAGAVAAGEGPPSRSTSDAGMELERSLPGREWDRK